MASIEATSLYRLFLRGLYNGDTGTVNFVDTLIDSGIDKAIDNYVADKRTRTKKPAQTLKLLQRKLMILSISNVK